MEQNRQKLGLLNLLLLLAVGAAGLALARMAQSFAVQVALVFVALGAWVTLAGWFQTRLEERERLEKMEFDELAKSPASSALFNAEGESLPARHAREQFERWFIPALTILLFLGEAAGAWLLWSRLAKATVAPLQQPVLTMSVFALFFLVLFLLGKYSARVAQLENQRLLRPGAAGVMLASYLCFAVTATLVMVEIGFPRVDLYVARALCLLLGVVAVETLFSLVLEIYRPRVKGRPARLLYESRLVGLLGQPDSLISTAAHALDYQFGFKVSDTWFYKFLERALAWLLLAQLGVLLLSTTFVFIEAGEQALLERFGNPVAGRTVLDPGLHFKLPWPIDQVRRFHTEQVQTFTIGVVPDKEREKEKTVLWTVSHYKEEFNLLVASRDPEVNTNHPTGKKSPPVNLLSVSIPVQFQITNLSDWAYHNESPDELLEIIATREVVRHLVGVDLNDIMSRGRAAAAQALRERIQAAADERVLGAKIIFVGLQDIHPPVAVAGAYEKVVGARQEREAKILAAEAYRTRTNSLAGAAAFTKLREAEADAQRQEVSAFARAALFTNQIPAFLAAPSVYSTRAYLQTFARASAGSRKYVLATTNTSDVILINLEDKVRADLLDAGAGK